MSLQEINDKIQQTTTNIFRNYFENIYVIEISSKNCTEYSVADFLPKETILYDKFILNAAKTMYKSDTATFFDNMALSTICSFLDANKTRYVVYCRQKVCETVKEYKLEISYMDDSLEAILIFKTEISKYNLRPIETLNELSHCNKRFQFLVDRLLQDFLEVNIKTGKCRVFPVSDGIEVRDDYAEQIETWSKSLIIPSESEAYKKEFELSNLLDTLHNEDGIHTSTYTATLDNTKRNFIIVSILVKENYGANDEFIFSYAQDITALKDQEERNRQLLDISQQLISLSQTDPLTELYNRSACEKMINEHLATCKSDIVGTMLLIDIDHFKDFNDNYGHQIGDGALKFLSKTMKDVFRQDDIICRWGGDEFVVFMRDMYSPNYVKSRIERLRARLLQCRKDEVPLPITISVGGTVAKKSMPLKLLFKSCDKSLYKIKDKGRDSFFVDFE